jgi:hypothetical protein
MDTTHNQYCFQSDDVAVLSKADKHSKLLSEPTAQTVLVLALENDRDPSIASTLGYASEYLDRNNRKIRYFEGLLDKEEEISFCDMPKDIDYIQSQCWR